MQHVETDRRNMMQNYPDFYPLAATAVLIAIGIGIGWMLFASDRLDGYGTNVWTEVLSIGVTVLVIERLNQRRAMRERAVIERLNRDQAEQQRKAELIQQLGSPSNDFALEAARLLGEMGVLTDGTLKNTKLREANLSGANLSGANLSGANLQFANLSGVNLWGANLSGAILQFANLSGAILWGANLSGAILSGAILEAANLSGANLYKTNLSGVGLREADLSGAILDRTTFDEITMLPDKSKWTPDTDLTRFTDPQHPNFWRSNYRFSPAYRGDSD